jgi:hypothetical protein
MQNSPSYHYGRAAAYHYAAAQIARLPGDAARRLAVELFEAGEAALAMLSPCPTLQAPSDRAREE